MILLDDCPIAILFNAHPYILVLLPCASCRHRTSRWTRNRCPCLRSLADNYFDQFNHILSSSCLHVIGTAIAGRSSGCRRLWVVCTLRQWVYHARKVRNCSCPAIATGACWRVFLHHSILCYFLHLKLSFYTVLTFRGTTDFTVRRVVITRIYTDLLLQFRYNFSHNLHTVTASAAFFPVCAVLVGPEAKCRVAAVKTLL
mmetsp:Transcript_22009/g.32324  ORF Transcript_22009/g.32324 Transcript_22009/m.32324 type:complete len:200 (-) Transcript_22009:931-1530(-)